MKRAGRVYSNVFVPHPLKKLSYEGRPDANLTCGVQSSYNRLVMPHLDRCPRFGLDKYQPVSKFPVLSRPRSVVDRGGRNSTESLSTVGTYETQTSDNMALGSKIQERQQRRMTLVGFCGFCRPFWKGLLDSGAHYPKPFRWTESHYPASTSERGYERWMILVGHGGKRRDNHAVYQRRLGPRTNVYDASWEEPETEWGTSQPSTSRREKTYFANCVRVYRSNRKSIVLCSRRDCMITFAPQRGP